MIARTHRFHGLNSLRHVYARGQTVRGPQLAIKYIFNNKRRSYRAAVVVSRKVHKSAVVRNRIRRRIYEIVRLHEARFQKPLDMVITVFSESVAVIESRELEASIAGQLERTGIFDAATEGREQPGSRAIVEQSKDPDN
jgi:ribonuclease P protein component